jgi:hypothetical protein
MNVSRTVRKTFVDVNSVETVMNECVIRARDSAKGEEGRDKFKQYTLKMPTSNC